MKKTSILLLISIGILAISCVSYQDQFEGSIDYDLTVSAIATDMVTQDQLLRDFGTKTTGYHKNGKFKDFGDAINDPIQLYLPENQLLYSYGLSEKDTIEAFEISNVGTQYNYEIIENADTILGYPCNLLIAKNDMVEKKYFFNPSFYINPKYYKNYKMGNRNELMERMQAPALRVIITSKTLKLVSEATKVNNEQLSDSIFMLPANRFVKNMW